MFWGEAEECEQDNTLFYHDDEHDKVQEQAGTRCWKARGGKQANQARLFQPIIHASNPVLPMHSIVDTKYASPPGIRSDPLPCPTFGGTAQYTYFYQANGGGRQPS